MKVHHNVSNHNNLILSNIEPEHHPFKLKKNKQQETANKNVIQVT